MSNQDPIVIVSAKRTPLGSFQGELSRLPAGQLAAEVVRAVIAESRLAPTDIDELLLGCVISAGVGQAPARQAALLAGLSPKTSCTTINKVCGSGMKAVMLAHDILASGQNGIMLAGGVESMSNAPYLLEKARAGFRLGHQEVKDALFVDGLEDAYNPGKLMGAFAEDTAEKYHFTREIQDAFAIRSLTRAQQAIKIGAFEQEIAPVHIASPKGDVIITTDEGPGKANFDKIPQLRPAFKKDGTVTAANSSSISDGAAALILMRESEAKKRGLRSLARIIAHASHSQEPALFTTAPVGAIKNVLEKANWSTQDVDLYEINEAFAVVTLAAIHDLALPEDKVNIHGGACALGHPLGASGARILVTLIHALHQKKLKRGVAALCIGGGEATAIALEVL